VPADGNVQDKVDVPEPVTLVGVRVQIAVSLLARFTTPAKPLSPSIVIVDAAGVPASTVTLVGLAVTVKSCTVNVAVVEWVSVPLVPVTVTWSVPDEVNVQLRLTELEGEMRVSVTLALLREQPGPPFWESATVPVKPFTAVTVMLETPVELASRVTEVGLAEIVKSWIEFTLTWTTTWWESRPLVPVTFTVYAPGTEPETVRVEFPEPATLVGLRPALRSVDEVVAVRPTRPLKPWSEATMMVPFPDPPATKLMVVGLAETVKS
jgi:hypothetical protein